MDPVSASASIIELIHEQERLFDTLHSSHSDSQLSNLSDILEETEVFSRILSTVSELPFLIGNVSTEALAPCIRLCDRRMHEIVSLLAKAKLSDAETFKLGYHLSDMESQFKSFNRSVKLLKDTIMECDHPLHPVLDNCANRLIRQLNYAQATARSAELF